MYNVHCTMYKSSPFKNYTLRCIILAPYYARTVQCTAYLVNRTMLIAISLLRSTVYAKCTLYTVQCILYIVIIWTTRLIHKKYRNCVVRIRYHYMIRRMYLGVYVCMCMCVLVCSMVCMCVYIGTPQPTHPSAHVNPYPYTHTVSPFHASTRYICHVSILI